MVIAIDGLSGSGKSTLADDLAARLNATVIHIDDFIGSPVPAEWWNRLVAEVLQPVALGAKTLSYACATWWHDQVPERVDDQPVRSLVILEGVGSFRLELDPYISERIFVECPVDLTLQRGLARDRGMDGLSDDQILAMWEKWLADSEAYFASHRVRERLGWQIRGDQPFEDQAAYHDLVARLSN